MRLDKQSGQGLVEYAVILVLVAVIVIVVLTLLGPQIGNTFSRISSGLGEQETAANTSNTPSQTASLTLVGGSPFSSKAKIEVGTIAISGIPEQMSVDDTLAVSATIKSMAPTISISSTLTQTEQGWTVQPYYERIQVFPRMSASLFGAGFDIAPDEPQERRTDVGIPATWAWTAAPVEAGDNRTLNLEVSVPVETYGVNDEKTENTQAIANFPFSIRVVGKSGLSARSEFLANWLFEILGLGILGSGAGWLFNRWWQRRNAEDNDQEDSSDSNGEPANSGSNEGSRQPDKTQSK